ncbi:MAG: GNAT family N-acetyltransferase [Eubacteriales bacterium]|nr:GNAT family N-acetyltransferase [Eubacteriales bacterium]
MKIESLSQANIRTYLDYLRAAMAEEPEMMTAERVDEGLILENLPSTTSLVAVEGGQVIGRLEYHFYSCLQDGCRMAYVNWVYVAKAHRHRGVAQALFREFEAVCRQNRIDQYYLIQARNPGAASFYGAFQNAESTEQPILRKNL